MQLCWSPRSPFVRKVMIVAHEAGVADRIELLRTPVTMTQVNEQVSRHNPLNKIPTLILADGLVLFDSLVICEYLDGLCERTPMFPREAAERLAALRRHALGSGLLDLLVLWRNERERPVAYQSPPHLEAFAAKVQRTLDVLEAEAVPLTATAYGIGHIAVGCSLAYLDFRFAGLQWRDARPALSAWYERFAARPSSVATATVME